jgi:hypothetical protein
MRFDDLEAKARGITAPAAGVFLLLSLLLAAKARSLGQMDYSRPVTAFLAEAEKRYRFIGPAELAYSIPLLIVLAVTGGRVAVDMLVPRYIGAEDLGSVVLGYAVFFLTVCGLGYYFTYRNWQKAKGRIWSDIRRMRQEMQ